MKWRNTSSLRDSGFIVSVLSICICGMERNDATDRRDDTINLCEMKWSSEAYVIDKDYDEKLRNKVAAFIRETGTRKSILISMVTTYGVKENMYSDAVQSQVVMDDLFA